MSIQEKLKVFDDPLFCFHEDYHRYTYADKVLTSVTQFITKFHLPFDSEKILPRYAKRHGLTEDEVRKSWKEKNEKSKIIGHSVHAFIENYYNNIPQVLPTDIEIIQRINSFNIAWAKYLHKLTPIAFEKRIFHKYLGIAGTLDALFYYNDKVVILDYKSNQDFRHDSHQKGCYNMLLEPFESYCQNNLNEYSIQVSLYSLILKEIAGIHVEKCFLLHLGNDGPQMYTAHDFTGKLSEWFKKQ